MPKVTNTMIKIILPFAILFLASCASTDYRDDYYYGDEYYSTTDSYDPYYGYGNSGYSTAGSGVYYNNYNYYPDRWGMSYSDVYYSPYRYPRVGFYYSAAYCGYGWYGSCYPANRTSFYYNTWPSYGFGWGLGFSFNNYSNYRYYDNNYWYNYSRNRVYSPYYPNNRYDSRYPTNQGYYSTRNEVGRIADRNRSNQYKGQQDSNNRYGNTQRTEPARRPTNRQRTPTNRNNTTTPRTKNNERSNQQLNVPSRSRSTQGSQETNLRSQQPRIDGIDQSSSSAANQLLQQRQQSTQRNSEQVRSNNNINSRYQMPDRVTTTRVAPTRETTYQRPATTSSNPVIIRRPSVSDNSTSNVRTQDRSTDIRDRNIQLNTRPADNRSQPVMRMPERPAVDYRQNVRPQQSTVNQAGGPPAVARTYQAPAPQPPPQNTPPPRSEPTSSNDRSSSQPKASAPKARSNPARSSSAPDRRRQPR